MKTIKYGRTIRLMLSRKYIREYEQVPFGYGFAYHRYELDASVYMPVPLNFLWGCLREGYYFIARGVGYRSYHDRDMYEKGYNVARIRYSHLAE